MTRGIMTLSVATGRWPTDGARKEAIALAQGMVGSLDRNSIGNTNRA
jgi:hypothetical protein